MSKDSVSICVKPIHKPVALTAIQYMGDNDHFLALLKEHFSKDCFQQEATFWKSAWAIPHGLLEPISMFGLNVGMWLVRQDDDAKITMHSDEEFRKEYWVVV